MSRLTRSLAFATLALAIACSPPKIDKKLEETLNDAGVDTTPPVITPPSLQTFALPKSKDGLHQLIEVAGSELDINPAQKDAITAVGACADLVTTCYRGGGLLDDCVQNARACETAQPWNEDDCCPAACATGFAAERATGAAPLAAFEKVYFLEPGCFPGVMDAVGGAP